MAAQTFKINGISSVKKDLDMQLEVLDEVMFNTLAYIGEKAVQIAREKGSYNDITGNLRSSIGYEIFKDGEPRIGYEFTQVLDGVDGTMKGPSVLAQMGERFPRGWVLVVVAGMEYASYVENIHGRDVLTSARVAAERLAKKLITKIRKKTRK